jgi:glucose-1-phosphate thymidylyltransferase
MVHALDQRMKALILAAGYATRLHPLTLTRAKPLLTVAGKPMIDHVLDNLAPIDDLDRVYVVSNARFADQFQNWADSRRRLDPTRSITVVNDGTTDDSNKLGAIGDLHLVLEREALDDDLIVVAGDNLFSQPLDQFAHYCRDIGTPVLAVYDVGDLQQITKYSAITVDAQQRITAFEEKPKNPTSTLTGIALYYYPRHILPLIRQYVAEGNNPDQPGRLVQWLYPRVPFHTWTVPGLWFDVGSLETLEQANRIFTDLAVGRAADSSAALPADNQRSTNQSQSPKSTP